MNHVVVGAGFGDEGKGQTVSNLIQIHNNIELVVRFNGGNQAGHTVEYNDIRHVFQNFGSGSLQGVPTYWSRFCTVYPITIKKEFELLQSKGCTPTLWIDPLCPVTTPWDVLANRQRESDVQHGSVGAGFGSTIGRQENWFKLFAEDLKTPSIFVPKMQSITDNYYNFGVTNELLEEWMDAVDWLTRQPTIKIQRKRAKYRNVIFEGAQGILLDQDFGFFPHVTRSKTTAYNAIEVMNELATGAEMTVYHISRLYHTRHGNGPFTEFADELKLKDDFPETNVYNEWQGEFKKAPLNMDWLAYAIKMHKEENRHLFDSTRYVTVFTCKDHLEDPENIPVVQGGKLQYKCVDEVLGAHNGTIL